MNVRLRLQIPATAHRNYVEFSPCEHLPQMQRPLVSKFNVFRPISVISIRRSADSLRELSGCKFLSQVT